VLQALDLDHDGQLSAQEIQAAPASLRTLDRDGDGMLTADELEPLRTDAGASPDELVQQLMTFDRNGDGVLTVDEVPERMRALFRRGDANGDGKLTADEIRAMVKRSGSPNGRPTGPGTASGMMRLDGLLNALDTDHDGVISAAEIEAASTSLLTLDTNHDGIITAQEMPVRQQTAAERVAHVLDEYDTNKDGKLSREEVPDRMRAQFDDADKNGDGLLDRDELLKMFTAMPQPEPKGGQGAGSAPKGRQ
jgi:Ca2+-binding EF-hand superfamily protein